MDAPFWAEINVPLLVALPFFLLFIGIEVLTLAHDDSPEDERPRGYLFRDARTSISMGLGSLVSMVIFKLATLVVYVALWQLVPWKLPADTWWSWAAMLVLVDLGWYCAHRFAHRVRLGWAGHQAHHSSEYFNFGTALRQKWNPWTEALFWLPLPLLGFPPWMIYIAFSFNLIYQFFIHTETVGKLPAPIELVFNTPSHHRVHHGSDPEYLDKNYGGILIVWDRLFGSFQEELHRPRYGLTKPVDTYNLLKLQYGEYARIVKDVRSARTWRERLGYVFGPPGWEPAARETVPR
ncbi:sterol desaturase family protein [Pseudonocardia sp. CA-107938]|uniref:sterol desaturase family protein n=1 Tax=Pseudonocardia sp. CA-107938 TaxID=3240021 RepID=UPI003D93B0AF